ncbi:MULTISPECIES: non-canonical purine NTP diphosphatase [Labilibaculum]|uniref:dITP/XTP pyrophosphatase n=2 Tax=Labilibaculum TaxID=2060722 RepID=A0A7M4DAM0_9BACT|nr:MULTISPECIES: non-canonical purine NTP diphosphatase [Labilibaculum]MUP39699.1 non-canonical purine NTP diphosphatase [Labilibaculum euxinus]MVB08904.1 non-canonical purine NTP diphosphatase [Labilibaculum euxinus]PKQ66685.1 non-canonical purine NTP pyrophosphatase [Labilibaculum manganireducens]
MKLVFATNNLNKLKELQNLLGEEIELLSLADINCNDEIPEDHETLEENASQKARYIFNKFNVNCFADDTGLEIESLNNEPGVYSARYAGEERDAKSNMKKVLENLKGVENRKSRFRTVISLLIDGNEIQFEGIVEGNILEKERGIDGFGYDPIFEPIGYDISFAEMDMTEKNKISHRGLAVRKLVDYLLSHKR